MTIPTTSAYAAANPLSIDPSMMGFGGSNISFLTPDALLQYCEDKLSSNDKQMNQLFSQESGSESITAAISKTEQDINSDNGTTGIQSATDCATIEGDYKAAIAAANGAGDSALAGELQSDLSGFQSKDGEGAVSTRDVQSSLSALQSTASDASNSSQMIMLQLQTLMSARQQTITSVTGMIQSFGDTTNSVAQKIGA